MIFKFFDLAHSLNNNDTRQRTIEIHFSVYVLVISMVIHITVSVLNKLPRPHCKI